MKSFFIICLLLASTQCAWYDFWSTHKKSKKVEPKVEPVKTDTAQLLANPDWELINVYRRPELGFTQGLSMYKGMILESCGNYGETKIQFLKLNEAQKTVETKKSFEFSPDNFGEGSAIIPVNGVPKAFMLTWLQKIAYRLDENLNGVETQIQMPEIIREGWGMTVCPEKPSTLYVSDGTDRIYECDSNNNLKVTATRQIKDPRGWYFSQMNELEVARGHLWANIYMTNDIVKIDLQTNTVVKRIDLSGLQTYAAQQMVQYFGRTLGFGEVLNGIAYNEAKDTFYITGKHWPAIYELKINV